MQCRGLCRREVASARTAITSHNELRHTGHSQKHTINQVHDTYLLRSTLLHTRRNAVLCRREVASARTAVISAHSVILDARRNIQ